MREYTYIFEARESRSIQRAPEPVLRPSMPCPRLISLALPLLPSPALPSSSSAFAFFSSKTFPPAGKRTRAHVRARERERETERERKRAALLCGAAGAFYIPAATMKIHRVDLHKYFHYGSFRSFISCLRLSLFISFSFRSFLSLSPAFLPPPPLHSLPALRYRYSSTIGYVVFN